MCVRRTGHQASIPEIDGHAFRQKARMASGDLDVNSLNIRTECGNGMWLCSAGNHIHLSVFR